MERELRQRAYSPATIRTYMQYVKAFLQSYQHFDEPSVRSFLESEQQRGISSTGLNIRINALRYAASLSGGDGALNAIRYAKIWQWFAGE